MGQDELISIITPMYNSEKWITETIECVLKQSYSNFEMIIVDDCSSDKSFFIAQSFANRDKRIKCYQLKKNSGAGIARNYALAKAKGKFIAYLDADDIWAFEKLEYQVQFMKDNNYAFTCTDYEKIDKNGNSLNKVIRMPKKITYNYYLRNTIIQTVGVMINKEMVGIEILAMENLRRRQDAALWCKLLKNGFSCYGIPKVLSYYRVVPNSLSSNKWKAMKGTWYLYRNIENLSFIKSCYCFVGYAYHAIKKRIYKRKNKENYRG